MGRRLAGYLGQVCAWVADWLAGGRRLGWRVAGGVGWRVVMRCW